MTTSAPPALVAGRPGRGPDGRVRRGAAGLVAGPALLAFALSVSLSWRPGMWVDEDATVSAADRPVGQLLTLVRSVDVVHLAYYLIEHVWTGLAGTSPFAMRLPSAFAVAGAAAGTVAVARRLSGSRRTALAAGSVFAVLPVVSYFGMEARSPAFACLGAVWTVWAFLRALSCGGTRWWLAHALLLGVTGIVHPYTLAMAAVTGIALATTRPSGSVALRWAAATALGVVLAAPVAVLSSRQTGQISWLEPKTLSDLPGQVTRLYFQGSRPVAVVAWALVLAGLVSALLGRRRVGPGGAGVPSLVAVALPWLLVPSAVVFTWSLVQGVYASRYLVFCVPGVALLAGLGVGAARSWRVGVVLVLVLAVAGVPVATRTRGPVGKRDDVLVVAQIVQAHRRPGDGVLWEPRGRRFVELGYPAEFAGLLDVTLDGTPRQTGTLYGTDVALDSPRSRLRTVSRLWVITQPDTKLVWPGVPDTATARAAGFTREQSWDTGRTHVLLLTRP